MFRFSRRRLLLGAGALGAWSALKPSLAALPGSHFDLEVSEVPFAAGGRKAKAGGINGQTPGPTLRWREGDTGTISVTNRLKVPTSIHWHGIRLPSDMDGVPGLSFGGIMPGE